MNSKSLTMLAVVLGSVLFNGLAAAADAPPGPPPGAPPASAPAAAPAAGPQATAEDAKAFAGSWTTTVQAPPGPMVMDFSVLTEGGKAVATVNNEMMGLSKVTDIKRDGDKLVLNYEANMMGMPMPVTLILSQKGSGLQADFGFMGGAFVMSGDATRKP